VGGKTVSQSVRANLFLDAGTNGGLFADIPNGLVGDGLFQTTVTGGAVLPST
jgi:hypothetical protein